MPTLPDEPHWAADIEEEKYLPYVVMRACMNFEYFYGLDPGTATIRMIDTRSALTVAGWADVVLTDYEQLDRERVRRDGDGHEEDATQGCWAFGRSTAHGGRSDVASQAASDHNQQIAKLISALGESGAGRRAILRAVASNQGVHDEDELEDLLHGRSTRKLQVPPGLREALLGVGLDHVIAPINLLTVTEPEQILINNDAWADIEFEVALDSGAVVHVCAPADCPGYSLEESPGSRRGQEFLMGDGGVIPNLGQKRLNLSDTKADMQSVFQIAAVTRPLMSVGKICDEGHTVTFSDVMAVVHNKEGEELCKFHRSNGGLYVAKLKLRSPAGFGRQE